MNTKNNNEKTIYLAGGCFWGTEKYFASIQGVSETSVGYANGLTQNPSYEEVCHHDTGHAETVKVIYDANVISLSFLLDLYYQVIDPTSVNKQGPDTGTQYRTGIYYIDKEDLTVIEESIKELQKHYEAPIAIEVAPLENYYTAEEYHQNYLDKNPGGYCHIGKDKFEKVKSEKDPSLN
jgi:peptide-methionine (S)-S-oxide reductase/peptide methionine sulfoxide reductase msrA/msrB